MSSTESNAVFDDLIDLLATTADADRLAAFRLPDASQARLDDLLEKNREGTLSDADRGELETFEQLEHVVRLLKARVHARRNES